MPECHSCSSDMILRFGPSVPAHWKCPKCSLECIFPQLDDETLGKVYDASYFVHYKSESDPEIVKSMKRATYTKQMRHLSEVVGAPAGKRMLDCGAATGYLAELSRELGWDSFAIEYSEFGARACEKVLGSDRVYRGQAQDSTFAANPEGKFSLITMFDFIEHVRDPRDVLRWAKQKLTTDGTLMLTTPRVGSLSWRLMGQSWFHYTSREHLWFFSPKSIEILLREYGFRSVEVRPLVKAVTIGYALGHYARSYSYSGIFTPFARGMEAIIPSGCKQGRMWLYLGEMVVIARA